MGENIQTNSRGLKADFLILCRGGDVVTIEGEGCRILRRIT